MNTNNKSRVMKKITIVMFVLLPFFSCKKNMNTAPSFSAEGYWTGHSSPINIGILNRRNGTSRLYLLSDSDTASVSSKYDGTYSVHGNIFCFKSDADIDSVNLYMKTTYNSSGSMSGILTIRSSVENKSSISFVNNKQ